MISENQYLIINPCTLPFISCNKFTFKMWIYDSLGKENDFFFILDGKRSAALVQVTILRKGLEAYLKNSSVRSFERIEARIDGKLDEMFDASEAVTSYFTKMGGDPLHDSSFENYCDTATNIIGEIEILRKGYNDVIKKRACFNLLLLLYLRQSWLMPSRLLLRVQGNKYQLLNSKPQQPHTITKFLL